MTLLFLLTGYDWPKSEPIPAITFDRTDDEELLLIWEANRG